MAGRKTVPYGFTSMAMQKGALLTFCLGLSRGHADPRPHGTGSTPWQAVHDIGTATWQRAFFR